MLIRPERLLAVIESVSISATVFVPDQSTVYSMHKSRILKRVRKSDALVEKTS